MFVSRRWMEYSLRSLGRMHGVGEAGKVGWVREVICLVRDSLARFEAHAHV